MERENLFLVILILAMLFITLYEASYTDKANIIMGSYYGSKDPGGLRSISGETLPPLMEYKSALRGAFFKSMNETIMTIISKDPSKTTKTKKMGQTLGKYYDKAFSRFMFSLNTYGKLTPDLIPKEYPIDKDDVKYFMNTYDLAEYFPVFLKYSHMNCPYWPKFNSLGPKVQGLFNETIDSEGNSSMINRVTGQILPVTSIQYNRLKSIYKGPPELFDNFAFTVLYVYHSLGSLGNNGSVPIGLINEEYIELFGSPLNTQQRYCSPFIFEKEYFGSLGSFFDYVLQKGQKYTCNPPYIDGLMAEAAKRVTESLKKLGPGSKTDVLVVIPIWDAAGLEEIGDPKDPNDPNKDEKYDTKEIIENSGLVRSRKLLNKNDHEYYSWYGNKFVSYSHTYLYVLSTEEEPGIDLDDVVTRWDILVRVAKGQTDVISGSNQEDREGQEEERIAETAILDLPETIGELAEFIPVL